MATRTRSRSRSGRSSRESSEAPLPLVLTLRQVVTELPPGAKQLLLLEARSDHPGRSRPSVTLFDRESETLEQIQQLCAGRVNGTFVAKALETAMRKGLDFAFLTLWRTRDPRRTYLPVPMRLGREAAEDLLGFAALVGTEDPKIAHLEAICSQRGYGSFLLRMARERARAWGMWSLRLDARPTVRPFFARNGFVSDWTRPGDGNYLRPMIAPLD